MIWYARMR